MPRVLAVLVLVVLIGCGSARPPKAAPVSISGQVTDTKGKPVSNVMLSFVPSDAENQDERPMAQVTADGTFSVSCVPGRYKVTMVQLPKAPGSAPAEGDVSTPEKAKLGKSGNPIEMMKGGSSQPSWDIEVKASGNEPFKLQVR